MHVFRFHQFGWRTAIHAPKIGVFAGFDPLNGETYQRNPQKAYSWAEYVIWRTDRQNWSTDATGARDEDTKNKERKTETET